MTTFRIYTKSGCGPCRKAKQLLSSKGISINEIKEDQIRSSAFTALSAEMERIPATHPLIFSADTDSRRHLIGGYDDLKRFDFSSLTQPSSSSEAESSSSSESESESEAERSSRSSSSESESSSSSDEPPRRMHRSSRHYSEEECLCSEEIPTLISSSSSRRSRRHR
jgi:glutaredoxin